MSTEYLGPRDKIMDTLYAAACGKDWIPSNDAELGEDPSFYELQAFLTKANQLPFKRRAGAKLPALTAEDHTVTALDGHEFLIRHFSHPAHGEGEQRPALIWIHGGGFIFNRNIKPMLNINQLPSDWVETTGADCFSVEYRLAEEGSGASAKPLLDVVAAIKWVHDNADRLGVCRSKIGLGGASAGGNLALAGALWAGDQQLSPPLASLSLYYPMLDPEAGPESHPKTHPMSRYFTWGPKANATGWRIHWPVDLRSDAPSESHDIAPYVNPWALPLDALPPTYIDVGTADMLLEGVQTLEQRLGESGVKHVAVYWPDMPHGYESLDWKDVHGLCPTEIVQQTWTARTAFLAACWEGTDIADVHPTEFLEKVHAARDEFRSSEMADE